MSDNPLTGEVSDSKLAAVFASRREAQDAADALMARTDLQQAQVKVIRPGSADWSLGRRLDYLHHNVVELLLAHPPGALAIEQVEALEAALCKAADMAKEIADGGDAYPVGARELAARLVADLPSKAETMKAIVAKSHP